MGRPSDGERKGAFAPCRIRGCGPRLRRGRGQEGGNDRLRGAARLIVPCDHPLILTAPRYTIFLRGDAVSNRIHPIDAPPGRCGCRRDDRHRGSKPSRGRSQGSRPFREYQPSTDGGWFPHYSGSSHGRSSPMDTRKCSTAVIAAKTPVTLWQEMAPGFAPAPVLTPVTGYRSSPAGFVRANSSLP
jgi:hypothetical protein